MKGFSNALLAASLALLGRVSAAPAEPPTQVLDKRAAPTVTTSTGTIVGANGILTEAFNGIPYALPPTGNLRLKPPVRLKSSLGVFDASGIGPACPQFLADTSSNEFLPQVIDKIVNTQLFKTILNVKEDCLTISVTRPKGTKAGDKLPVLFWIFGGGFEVSNPAYIRDVMTKG